MTNVNNQLKYIPIVSQKRERITNVKKTPIPKKDLKKRIGKLILFGSMTLLLYKGATNTYEDVKNKIAIETTFDDIKSDARDILRENSSVKIDRKKDQVISMYDHSGIAEDIKLQGEKYGDVYKDALIAEIMGSIQEWGYDNMDRIISYLTTESDIRNKEDFLHAAGYESEEAYLESMKVKYYQAIQEQNIREKYDENKEGMKR